MGATGRVTVWDFYKYHETENISVCQQKLLRSGELVVCRKTHTGRPLDTLMKHLERYHPVQFREIITRSPPTRQPLKKKRKLQSAQDLHERLDAPVTVFSPTGICSSPQVVISYLKSFAMLEEILLCISAGDHM